MPRRNMLLKVLVFSIVLVMAILHVSGFFGVDFSRNRNNWVGLQKEKKRSMDAIFIGASNVSAFWQPLFGWADHGIAVWSISVSGLTCAAIKYMIIEARKTQPDALYIVNLSTFKGGKLYLDVSHMHNALDYMPLSLNKFNMVHDLVSRSEFKGLDALEYYLAIIRFHSRWDDLKPWIFGSGNISLKMSNHASSYCKKVFNSEKVLLLNNDVRSTIPKDVSDVLEDLLDYCDEQHVKVLFVKSPQVVSEKGQGRMNAMEDILEARGYPCLDLLEDMYKADIDPRTDFFNKGHTNIHGSMKFSKAVGDYLVENYGFEDKRGLPDWESWDAAMETYNAYREMYTLPLEREHAQRFFSDIPALAKKAVDEQRVRVSWTEVGEIDGYAVFRRTNRNGAQNPWQWISDVGADVNEYTDDGLNASTEYIYTVVPYREADGTREYGSFDVLGVSVKTKEEKA